MSTQRQTYASYKSWLTETGGLTEFLSSPVNAKKEEWLNDLIVALSATSHKHDLKSVRNFIAEGKFNDLLSAYKNLTTTEENVCTSLQWSSDADHDYLTHLFSAPFLNEPVTVETKDNVTIITTP